MTPSYVGIGRVRHGNLGEKCSNHGDRRALLNVSNKNSELRDDDMCRRDGLSLNSNYHDHQTTSLVDCANWLTIRISDGFLWPAGIVLTFFAFACALVTPGCTQGNATSFLSLPRRTAHLLGRMNSCGTTLTFNTAASRFMYKSSEKAY